MAQMQEEPKKKLPEQHRKRLLFVCSGNACRSPMAMIVAMNQIGDKAECDSAAGKLQLKGVKLSKKAAAKGMIAVKKRYGETSAEYKRISQYVPKWLSIELVKWATDILFFGKDYMDNAKAKFPMEYHDKMKFYGRYGNSKGITMHEIPDPYNGMSWPDYYGLATPKPLQQESYEMVLQSMDEDFQPKLTEVLWPSKK